MQQQFIETPNIGIAVYNEGKHLEKVLKHLKQSLLQIPFREKPELFICLNGCNDNSVHSIIKSLEALNGSAKVHILSSKKGKLRAHKAIIEKIDNNRPIIFMDADVFVGEEVIRKLLETIKENEKILVASAYPYVLYPRKISLYEKIIFPIINLKRIHPEIEIAKNDVSIFHPSAKSYFEKKSRIYFHGRCFIIRDKFVYNFPREGSEIVGDDTFLSFCVLHNSPPGSIIVLYDAKVFCRPQLSIKSYLKSWYRIRKDIDNIYCEYPKFKRLKKYADMKFNWGFIFSNLNIIEAIQAILFVLLRKFEFISYKILSSYINAEKVWSYNSEEKLR